MPSGAGIIWIAVSFKTSRALAVYWYKDYKADNGHKVWNNDCCEKPRKCVVGGGNNSFNGYIVQGSNIGRKTDLKSSISRYSAILKPKEICLCLNSK